MMSSRDRYRQDPLFRMLVDTIYRLAEQAHADGNTFTPTELREAAMVAAIMMEERHMRPILVDGYDRPVAS
jgi:hypothetical protein